MKVCPICAEEIESTSGILSGREVHLECLVHAAKPETALEYALSYPDKFAEYLTETLTCTDHPKECEALLTLLADFRDNDFGGKTFADWICDNV